MNRRTAITCAMLATLGALGLWWLVSTSNLDAPDLGAQVPRKHANRITPATGTFSPRPAVVEDSSWNPALIDRVEQKYHPLLADTRIQGAQVAELCELLLQQEQLRTMVKQTDDTNAQFDLMERGEIESALLGLDSRIRGLLDSTQYARYETLRDLGEPQTLSQSSASNDFTPTDPTQRQVAAARSGHECFEAKLRDLSLPPQSLRWNAAPKPSATSH